MDFRNLLDKLDVLSENLTMSGLIAATSGYEQDDNIRYPIIAKLAQSNGFEGLVDPVSGNYIDTDGDDDDEVPFDVAQKLSAAGLLPSNAKLPQAGWFDDDDIYKAAGAHLTNQSQQAMAAQAKRSKLIAQYAKIKAEIYRLAREAGVDPKTVMPAATQTAPTPISRPDLTTDTLGSTAMNNYAKNRITPTNMPSLSEAIIQSMNEDFDPDAAWAAAKGAYQGATFGLAPDINAGVKSLVKGTQYKDELPGEVERFRKADREYPRAYTGGQVAGALLGPGKGLGLAKTAAIGSAAIGGQAALRGGYGADIPDETPVQSGADAQPTTTADPAQVNQSVQFFQSALNQQFGENVPTDGEFNPQTVEVIKKHILQKYGEQK